MTGSAARVAVSCWVAGAGVLGVTWWDAGNQVSSATQLPALIVAFGAGLGLVVVGGALWGLDRARARGRRVDRALADLVHLAEGSAKAGVR
jgi:hypothetical protein